MLKTQKIIYMKLSKSLLQAMLIAVTASVICSCEKPPVDQKKNPTTEKTNNGSTPDSCPGCGMG